MARGLPAQRCRTITSFDTRRARKILYFGEVAAQRCAVGMLGAPWLIEAAAGRRSTLMVAGFDGAAARHRRRMLCATAWSAGACRVDGPTRRQRPRPARFRINFAAWNDPACLRSRRPAVHRRAHARLPAAPPRASEKARATTTSPQNVAALLERVPGRAPRPMDFGSDQRDLRTFEALGRRAVGLEGAPAPLARFVALEVLDSFYDWTCRAALRHVQCRTCSICRAKCCRRVLRQLHACLRPEQRARPPTRAAIAGWNGERSASRLAGTARMVTAPVSTSWTTSTVRGLR